ncbi:hypothetical protein BK126_24355 [Paenibacillus sp. FSL H7-0326]|nr:hypothetical protein BK126_24355 [Paenibacillus sp. FSL H7-0326]
MEQGETQLDVARGGYFGARGNAVFVLLTPVVFAWTRVGRGSNGPSKSQKSFSSQKQLIPEKGSVRNPHLLWGVEEGDVVALLGEQPVRVRRATVRGGYFGARGNAVRWRAWRALWAEGEMLFLCCSLRLFLLGRG